MAAAIWLSSVFDGGNDLSNGIKQRLCSVSYAVEVTKNRERHTKKPTTFRPMKSSFLWAPAFNPSLDPTTVEVGVELALDSMVLGSAPIGEVVAVG